VRASPAPSAPRAIAGRFRIWSTRFARAGRRCSMATKAARRSRSSTPSTIPRRAARPSCSDEREIFKNQPPDSIETRIFKPGCLAFHWILELGFWRFAGVLNQENLLMTPTSPAPWYRTLTREHWFVFAVASLAWLFDCLDQQLFILARDNAIRALSPPGTDALVLTKL